MLLTEALISKGKPLAKTFQEKSYQWEREEKNVGEEREEKNNYLFQNEITDY